MVRGFQGPERHNMYMMQSNATAWWANLLAVAALAGLCYAVYYLR